MLIGVRKKSLRKEIKMKTQEKIQFIWDKYMEQGEDVQPLVEEGDLVAVTLSEAIKAWDTMPVDASFGDDPRAILGAFLSYLVNDLAKK